MEIREQLSRARQKAQARVENYRHTVVETARRTAQRAAQRALDAKTPIRIVAQASRRVNDLSHEYFSKLVTQQFRSLENVIEDGTERLSRAAEAQDFRALIAGQAKLYPASRERLGRDLRATWELAAESGRELGSIVSETYAQLIHGVKTSPVHKAPRRRKSTRARKTTKAH
jgi:phasin family protein